MLPSQFSNHLADYERLAETLHEANPRINVEVKRAGFEEVAKGLAAADFLIVPE